MPAIVFQNACLATLHGCSAFLLKIFWAQMGYKKGMMGSNGLHQYFFWLPPFKFYLWVPMVITVISNKFVFSERKIPVISTKK